MNYHLPLIINVHGIIFSEIVPIIALSNAWGISSVREYVQANLLWAMCADKHMYSYKM